MGEAGADRPRVVIVAGPNGAGKSTTATRVLPAMRVQHFVNADVIARGLSAFRPESVAFQAGRVMREWLNQLGEQRVTFAFETTLASKTIVSFVRELCTKGYEFHLFFFWIPSADVAVARVAQRVRTGGHHVDEATVRRRYDRGLSNFFRLYRPLATHWRFSDNSAQSSPHLVAFGDENVGTMVVEEELWDRVSQRYGHGGAQDT